MAQRWPPRSAEPATVGQFRAELNAQQLERLLAQVDQQAEALVAGLMRSQHARPVPAQGDRPHAAIKLGIDVHLER